MIAEIVLIAGSWHPVQDGMNGVNPGALAEIAEPLVPHVNVYACGGVYKDSHETNHGLTGFGLRSGWEYGGFDIAFLHTKGSDAERVILAPVPSVYVGAKGCFAQVSLFGSAVAFSMRFEVARF